MTAIWRGFFEPIPDGPFIADVRTFDIPGTIAACIRNAAPGMVGVTLSRRGGPAMIAAAEEAARERGISITWIEEWLATVVPEYFPPLPSPPNLCHTTP